MPGYVLGQFRHLYLPKNIAIPYILLIFFPSNIIQLWCPLCGSVACFSYLVLTINQEGTLWISPLAHIWLPVLTPTSSLASVPLPTRQSISCLMLLMKMLPQTILLFLWSISSKFPQASASLTHVLIYIDVYICISRVPDWMHGMSNSIVQTPQCQDPHNIWA